MLVDGFTFAPEMVLIVLLLAAGSALLLGGTRRREIEVYEALTSADLEEKTVRYSAGSATLCNQVFDDTNTKIGLLDAPEKKAYLTRQWLIPVLMALCGAALHLAAGASRFSVVLFSVVGLGLVGVALRAFLQESRNDAYARKLELHLPLVMERIVMAVQAGHDITSAVRTVIELENARIEQGSGEKMDPVTALLQIVFQLTSGNLTFEESLRYVAQRVKSISVKHAFVYLALAHKQGGGITGPLKELADSSQLFYQENIEESIAKLPAKATGPLALCFIGVLCSFLATPLVSIVSMLSQLDPEQRPAIMTERR